MHLAVGNWFEKLRAVGFLRAARPVQASEEALSELGALMRSIRHRDEGRAWTGKEKREAMQGVRNAYRRLAQGLQDVEDNSYFAPEIFHPPYMREDQHRKVRDHMDGGLLFSRNEIICSSTGEILREETFDEQDANKEVA